MKIGLTYLLFLWRDIRHIIFDAGWRLQASKVAGIISIPSPFERIVVNVLADGAQFRQAADDVFVIVALPEWRSRCGAHFIDAFCGGGFE